MGMYLDEYNLRFPPANYHAYIPGPPDHEDRTWVQIVSRYARSMDVFECPADNGRQIQPEITAADDMDAAPDNDWGEFYIRSLRTNYGFNYVYLSPVVFDESNGTYRSFPSRNSAIKNQSKTLLFVDSVWSRDKNGHPVGGGQWIVYPPCQNVVENLNRWDSFPTVTQDHALYRKIAPDGWDKDPLSGNRFGGAWGWHDGKATQMFADGHAATRPINSLYDGCQFQEAWQGVIVNQSKYIWDPAE